MKHGTKVATCRYCRTKAALVLRGEKRHELTCSSCGAPLQNMRFMPVSTQSVKKTQKPSYAPQKTKKKREKYAEYKPKRKRKSLGKRFFEDVFDVFDDIFD